MIGVNSRGGRPALAAAVFLAALSLLLVGGCGVDYGYWCKCKCPGDVDVPFGTACVPGEAHKEDAEVMCPGQCQTYCGAQQECTLVEVREISNRTEYEACTLQSKVAQLSAIPQNTSIEGPIDFGLSYLDIRIPSQNDRAWVNLKGKIAVVGGTCAEIPNQPCPIEFWYVDVSPVTPAFYTQNPQKRRKISDLTAFNLGVWSGTKNADNTFVLSPASKMVLSATVDDNDHVGATVSPSGLFGGQILYDSGRNLGAFATNALVVDGNFVQGEYQVHLHIHTWITSCQPVVHAEAVCEVDADRVIPPRLSLTSNLSLLGSLQNQDLCNAMAATDPFQVCRAGGSVEFPTFACLEQPMPNPFDPSAVAQHLKIHWLDANRQEIGTQPSVNLNYMPRFPITLRVENEWGRGAEDVIHNRPNTVCPGDTGMLTVNPTVVLFTYIAGGPLPFPKVITVGGVAIPYATTTAVSSSSGGVPWLSVIPASGTTPGNITIAADGSRLLPGVYTGTVTVSSPAQSSNQTIVPVTLTVKGSISTSRPSLMFTQVQGASPPSPQTIGVSPIPSNLTYTVTTFIRSGGSEWLKATASPSDNTVQVSVNGGSLPAGRYDGTVRISAREVNPVEVKVRLNVAPSF